MGSFVVVAHLTVKTGAWESVSPLLEKLTVGSRQESGCLEYRVQRLNEKPEVVLIYERYVDEASFVAHKESTHFNEVAPLLHEFLDEALHVELYNEILSPEEG